MRERRIEIALLECGKRFVEIVPVACRVVRNRKGSQERMCRTAAGEMNKVTLEEKTLYIHILSQARYCGSLSTLAWHGSFLLVDFLPTSRKLLG